jgi:hypothetical protein
MSKTPVSISASKVQARFRDLVVPRQINLTSGRRAKRLHQYPACGGRGSGGRDHSKLRLFRPWFSAVRPPGSAKTNGPGRLEIWLVFTSGGFHYGSLYDDACGHIFPERHEQFSRERYDGSLLETAATAHNSFFKPQGKRRLWLMAQP